MQFVRKYGGINPQISSKDINGELRAFGLKESGTTGILNRNSRLSLRAMAELAADAGFIEESGSEKELLEKLDMSLRKDVFSRFKSDYNADLTDLADSKPETSWN